MLAGKYLNSEPCMPRPEFDRWVCGGKTPSGTRLTNPYPDVDGTMQRFTGLQPTILANDVASFIHASTQPLRDVHADDAAPAGGRSEVRVDACEGDSLSRVRPRRRERPGLHFAPGPPAFDSTIG